MSRTMKLNDCIEICEGAILRSDGGDMPLDMVIPALYKLNEKKPISYEVVPFEEMDDNLYAISAAKLGPISMKGDSVFSIDESVKAIRRHIEIAEKEGKKVGYIYTGEHDCVLIPFYAQLSMATGLPILDVDGSGRSVPTLGNLLPYLNGKSLSPMVMSTIRGALITVETEDPRDYEILEKIGRSLVTSFDTEAVSITFPPISKKECAECMEIDALAKLQATGKAIIHARNCGLDPVSELLKVFDGKEICRGKVTAKEWECRDGFDFGHFIVTSEGKEYKFLIQNEILAVQNEEGEFILTAPDSVGIIDMDKIKGITNDEVEIGKNVAMIAIKAADPWHKIPGAIESWMPTFRSAGIKEDIEYVLF